MSFRGISFAQLSDTYYQSIVNNVSYDSVFSNLLNFENFGVKNPGSQGLNNTLNWVISKYSEYGYTDIKIDTFTHNGNYLYNVVTTKTGTLHPDIFVIIDGHYDTVFGSGTNDNGSGTSVILEIARVIKNIFTEYSLRFINFSAEEEGFLGSEHYVTYVVNPQNMQIRLVINIDEVGGVAGYSNDTVKCESDQSYPLSNNAASAAFTDTLATLTELYSPLNTKITNAYSSDYVPFQQNGEIITGYYENNASNYPHTVNDLLINLDTNYVYKIAKAATAAALYFARAYNASAGNQVIQDVSDKINVSPNPFQDKLFIKAGSNNKDYFFSLYNETGQMVMKKELYSNNLINVPPAKSSFYFYLITDNYGGVIKKGKLFRVQ